MDAEILAAAGSRRALRRTAAPPPDCCSKDADGLCRRFGLYVADALCDACRSGDPARRAETRQALGMADLAAKIEPLSCVRRSRPIGRRRIRCGDRRRDMLIYLCGERRDKTTKANCALCPDRQPSPEGREP